MCRTIVLWLTVYSVFVCAGCDSKDILTIKKWAKTLGNDLWELANAVGRPNELLAKYTSMNVRVEDKHGDELVTTISESVGKMLRRKMDAVTCIRMYAEDNAVLEEQSEDDSNFTYYSGKYSPVNDTNIVNLPDNMRKNESVYRPMYLAPDPHFYNIPVNTSFSSVHIPTNVYDLQRKVLKDIKRTESLDEIFRSNYKADPALSWQYFGSVTGMLRQYPAMQWRTDKAETTEDDEENVDIYDCRVRSWFIEATTCSKDMVILIDASGSMKGKGKTIAISTAAAILDTLSNNDFVTVLIYSNETGDLVPCFEDMLVQATPENIDVFKESMNGIKTDGVANLTEAFTRAFTLLKTYRENRGCGADTPCNQLIMLVTDGVSGNLTEVFQTWNWQDNSTHIPVRVFTYLIGKEITKVREIQWMACLNRGYYTPVQTMKAVREQVLMYIPVVARPLVLQGVVHPVVWTHTYADITNPALATWLWLVMTHEDQKSRLEKHQRGKQLGVRINEDNIYIQQLHKDEDVRQDPSTLNTTAWQEYRLLTSVSTPVFNRTQNLNTLKKTANLLGVAGTDVPIDDIQKLTLPYKLGVNGYAFIVSNNGYVILHPDLRPVYKGRLKLNYNSVDLTEVEILHDGRNPRDPGEKVLELRAALVDHKRGNLTGVPVKLHYDDNRRVFIEERNYFYAPLPGTPFGLAVAIPNYGKTWIKVGEEIRRSQNMNIKIADYFVGDHWRVHPGWVYCRYHYLEGHKFGSPEDELRHFLDLLDKPGWRWAEQYEDFPMPNSEAEEKPNCGGQPLTHDDYYCNRELMQLLVFDAKATNNSYAEKFVLTDEHADTIAGIYGVFLRFVATQSGLTRWQHLNITSDLPDADDGILFGDLHRRAVNEPWYKGAIFQNAHDPNSVSLTVPWQAGRDAVVTASLGIFPRDGGKIAPAAVTGFQMPMRTLYERFVNLTSVTTADDTVNCEEEWIDCYLIDQNGYIVISEAHNDTGQFLGTQEGAIMNSMVGQGLYYAVDIYDYQAWCEETYVVGTATGLTNPLRYLWKLLLWFLLRVTWFATQFANLPFTYGKVHTDEDAPDPPPPPKLALTHYPCDQKRTLYMLNNTVATAVVTNHSNHCSKPFYAVKVPYTNLLLLVIDSMHSTCYKRLEITPVNIPPSEYTNGTADRPCHKILLNDLKRRRLEGCFTEHPLEREIDACGNASRLTISGSLLLVILIKALHAFEIKF